jgi:hypothetical protein
VDDTDSATRTPHVKKTVRRRELSPVQQPLHQKRQSKSVPPFVHSTNHLMAMRNKQAANNKKCRYGFFAAILWFSITLMYSKKFNVANNKKGTDSRRGLWSYFHFDCIEHLCSMLLFKTPFQVL